MFKVIKAPKEGAIYIREGLYLLEDNNEWWTSPSRWPNQYVLTRYFQETIEAENDGGIDISFAKSEEIRLEEKHAIFDEENHLVGFFLNMLPYHYDKQKGGHAFLLNKPETLKFVISSFDYFELKIKKE